MSKERVLGIIRHTLTFVGGFLVMKGLADEVMVTEVVGSVVGLVGVIWSIVDKD
jgi:hypothetical protein